MGRGSRGQDPWTSCQDALGTLPHTRSPPPVPLEGHPAATTEGPDDRGYLGTLRGEDTCRSLSGMWPGWGRASLPRLSLASSSKKEGDGTRHEVAARTLPLLGATARPGIGSWSQWSPVDGDVERTGEVGLPPLIPPRRRKGPAPNLQTLLAPSPGRGWKVVDNETNERNVGHVIDC